LGVWINSLAFIPSSYLGAIGKPKTIATFHMAELLPFLGILWLLIHFFGLAGAAVAWSLRVAIDAVLLFWASGTHLSLVKKAMPAVILLIVSFGLSSTVANSLLTAILCGVVCTALAVSWAWTIDERFRSICDRMILRFFPKI